MLQEMGFDVIGCSVGAATAAAVLANMALRVGATPYDPNDWPGAKAWPAVLGLITFFELAVFLQALTVALRG